MRGTANTLAKSHHLCFAGLILLGFAVFYRPLRVLIGSALNHEAHSQVLLVVPITAALLYWERGKVFAHVRYSVRFTIVLLSVILAFFFLPTPSANLGSEDLLSYSILLFSCWCIAAFLFCYGVSSFRAAAFALLFLILMAPLPEAALAHSISFLQNASADATSILFTIAGIPFTRDGTVFTLPRVTIEIVQECSGIRSSLILVISGLVLAHLFLRTTWAKLMLVLLIVPAAVAKNAVRIFTLSTLGMYVDRSFLTGNLHHHGGIVFFALGFVGLWAAIWCLKRLENRLSSGRTSPVEQLARP